MDHVAHSSTSASTAFLFVPMDSWPPLTWVAVCTPGDRHSTVYHGSRVEIANDWFCEAVWAGDFHAGDFDRTDLASGSGGRAHDQEIVFVSSGSTVDRLVSCEYRGKSYVSNSLVGLLAMLDLSIDPLYPRYYEDFRTIVEGLDKYRRFIHTSGPPVQLTYFSNLVWNWRSLVVTEKPSSKRCFPNFESYREFLEHSLAQIGRNMADAGRRFPYRPMGTLSRGYDSPAVAVLAKAAGNTEVLAFRRSREGGEDNGGDIAPYLDLTSIALDRDEWRNEPMCEIPFIAADAYGEEMHYVAAKSYLTGRVLLTGYHGDKMWDSGTHDLSPTIKRGDPSGLALTEWRLWTGFLHCPVPFFSVRNIDQTYAITTSEEMNPWRIGNGYDRPICRRIVESAGVPRHLFGTTKGATSVVLWLDEEDFLPKESLEQFQRWLGQNDWRWILRGRLPPRWKARRGSLANLARRAVGVRTKLNDTRYCYFPHLFPWALDLAKKRYATAGVERADSPRLAAAARA